MKTDLYTKSILTVIAIALIGLFFKSSPPIPNANAATTESKQYSLIPVNSDGSINVRLPETVDVNVVDVETTFPVLIMDNSLDVEVQNQVEVRCVNCD